MAQFPSKIPGYALGTAVPSGWAKATGGTYTPEVALDASAPAWTDRVLDTTTTTASGNLYWSDLGTALDDSEILALYQPVGPVAIGTVGVVGVRQQTGSDSNYGGCFVANSTTGGVEIALRNLGTGGTLASTNAPFTWSAGNWYWLRLRVSGHNVSFTVWAMGGVEPASPQITAIYTSLATGALSVRFTTWGHSYAAISGATDTDVAPMGAIRQYENVIPSLALGTGIPAGWAKANGTFTNDVTSDLSVEWTDRVLSTTGAVTAGSLYWDDVGAVGDSEILTLAQVLSGVGSGGSYSLAQLRQKSNADSDYRISLLANSTSGGVQIQLQNLNAGTATNINAAFTWSAGSWYWARLRAIGSAITAAVWAMNDPEPAPQLSATWTTFPTGYPGIRFTGSPHFHVYAVIAVGILGDSAPKPTARLAQGLVTGAGHLSAAAFKAKFLTSDLPGSGSLVAAARQLLKIDAQF